jgi:hypothetical protein
MAESDTRRLLKVLLYQARIAEAEGKTNGFMSRQLMVMMDNDEIAYVNELVKTELESRQANEPKDR